MKVCDFQTDEPEIIDPEPVHLLETVKSELMPLEEVGKLRRIFVSFKKNVALQFLKNFQFLA